MVEHFFVVWNEIKGMPRVKHSTGEEAFKEAERLAREHPKEKFHVLTLVDSVKKKDTVWASELPEDLPF